MTPEKEAAGLFCVSKLCDPAYATARIGNITDAFLAGAEWQAKRDSRKLDGVIRVLDPVTRQLEVPIAGGSTQTMVGDFNDNTTAQKEKEG